MLITVLLAQAVIIGVLATVATVAALGCYLLLTGRFPVWQFDRQPSVGWDKVPSVLHRVKGMR